MRARARWVAVALWAAACVLAQWTSAQHDDNQPLLAPMGDCATSMSEEMAPLRHVLPARAVLGFAGPSRDRGCDPMFVAQYALAPAYIVQADFPDHRLDLATRQRHLLAEQPELVLAWGAEGRVWMRSHPGYRPVRRTENATLVWREP